jgi:flagellar protein FliS
MAVAFSSRGGRACSQYQALEFSSRIESAGPHTLVSILYDALRHSLEIVSLTLDDVSNAAGRRHADRARSILIALEGNLDFESGGELAQTLASVYRAMRRALGTATVTRDHSGLNALRTGVDELARSWSSIRR